MPIVTVQLVRREVNYTAEVIQILADELGKIFGSPPGTTWVKVSYIDAASYAENQCEPENKPQPVFVEVLKRSMDAEDILAVEAVTSQPNQGTLSRPI